MKLRAVAIGGLTLAAGLVAACGEPEVSKLTYADVQAAAEGKDEAAFRKYFQDIKGERVAWSGQVVEVLKEHGDDFVEITMLAVDMDGGAGGDPKADLVFPVSASFAEELSAGREVKFTGLLEDLDWVGKRPVLRLDVKDVE